MPEDALTAMKCCLVLGGSGYVGAAVCRTRAARGARVAFTYRTGAAAAQALAGSLPGAQAMQVELADFAAVNAAVETSARVLGGLHAIVQCAGTAGDPSLYRTGNGEPRDRFMRITEGGWDDMMDVTVKSTFAACQAAARIMGATGGEIVVVGSMNGVKSVPAPVHYAASKGALRAMVQALAKALGASRIRVNMVAPGILEGGMASLLGDDLLEEYLKHCSLKRTGTAAEIAELVAWLALENTYVTGQAIVLDGGL
jgi:NAD(P)-dependent dehydrogenase (short-subunit alcohol dehydrogenase family)